MKASTSNLGRNGLSFRWEKFSQRFIYFLLFQFVLLSGPLLAQDPNLPPSGNFELIDWKVTLPDQSEVKEQQLSSGFESPNEFYTDPNTGAMVFRCPNNGATGGSTYPRSELREMLRRGNTSISTTGIGLNNWVFSTSSQSNQDASGGVDGTLSATVAVDHVSTSGNSSMIGRVIIGQIHAGNDEPCRLYYRKLPGNTKGSIYIAHEPGNGNSEQWYDMIGSRSSSASDPADGIALGEQFSYEIKAEGNTLTVTIMRPGKPDVVEIVDMSNSGFANDWMYFKAGCYNQNNSGNSGDYAQVSFFALSNTHSSANNSAPTASITAPSNGATYTAGDNITINANASDSDGSITKVEFFQGATKLGEDTSSPYSYTWNNVSAGSYNLTATATDNEGATGSSSAVSVTVNSGTAQYTLTTNTSGQGSVSANPSGGTYDDGTIVSVTATPNSGYQFDGWTGDATGTQNPVNVTMDANKTVTATFSQTGGTYNAPYDIPRFQSFIGECKLQAPTSSQAASQSELINGYTSSWFYVADGDKVAFNQSGSSQRTELRYLTNWDLTQQDRSLHARINIVQQTCDQVTVMQIHDDANAGSGPNKPLVRIYKHQTKSPVNHLWAAYKTDTGGTNTTHIDLGPAPSGYFNCDIRLVGGNMIIDVDGVQKANVDVSFWTFPSYWKAGVYLQDAGEATAYFDELYEGNGSGGNNSPTTSITSPANGASFTSGDNITINASASDTDGTITKVEFFQGATKLGEDLTSPYSYTWNNVSAGNYDLTSVATDDGGATGTSSVVSISVNAPNVDPTTSITSPANGAGFTAGDNITITADASDSDGSVSKVEFFQGATKLGEDLTAPYSYTWNNVSTGNYDLTSVATDDQGATGTSAVVSIAVNDAPTTSITSPANGASFSEGDNITITSDASDTDGTISKVEFFQGATKLGEDLTAPYSYTWNSVAAGNYDLTSVATDDDGATGTSTVVSISVIGPNVNPTTSITSPANGASFVAGDNVTINADASDSDGSVSKVEFFQGATKLGEDLSAPYSYTWNNVAAGSYDLTTVATDDLGGTGTSAVVSISVATGPPANVALNKSVTVSSEQSSNPGPNLVDDNPDSRWSASGFPQWAEIDLGATYSISSTELVCFSDRAYQYIIEASTNGSSYWTIVDRSSNTTPGSNSSPITDNFSAVDARYVRITVSGASGYSGSWVSLEELRVFGVAGGGSSVPVSGVSMTPASATLAVGNTQQLSPAISPANATNQGVTYSSNNASVATVDTNGLVTAVSAGSATITVTTDDGGYTDTSAITVESGGGGGWTEVSSEDFESGWGIWNDGGSDARRYTGGTYAHQGSASMAIQDNSSSSIVTTDNLSLGSYTDLKVDFWFKPVSMENGEDFWLQISTDGGSNYTTVQDWVIQNGSSYENNNFYQESVELLGYSLTDQTRVRFRCDASGNGDDVYIDEVVISAQGSSSARTTTVVSKESESKDKTQHSISSSMKVYPNPVRDVLTVEYQLAAETHVVARVYNMSGKVVRTLLNERKSAGSHLLEWRTSSNGTLPSGFYLLQMQIGDEKMTERIILSD